ncbi:MAG: hypothetical protein ACIPMY_05605 [Rickettsia endosymbiont of Pentastiridius leporinus]
MITGQFDPSFEKLSKAIKSKDSVKVQQLISKMDISELIKCDKNGNSLLDIASHNGLAEIWKMIFDKMHDHLPNEAWGLTICAVMDGHFKNMANTLRDLKHEEASLKNNIVFDNSDSDNSRSCSDTEILGSDSDRE